VGCSHKFQILQYSILSLPQATVCSAAPSELLSMATRHEEALTGQKLNVALLSDILWLCLGSCLAEHAEHACSHYSCKKSKKKLGYIIVRSKA